MQGCTGDPEAVHISGVRGDLFAVQERHRVTHDRLAVHSTVQAAHWPSPQPNFAALSLRSSRNTYGSGVRGSVSTSPTF